MFERVRHFILLPKIVDNVDPFPAEFEVDMPIQLIMIPGRPATALPADTVYKLKGSNIGIFMSVRAITSCSDKWLFCFFGPFVSFLGLTAALIIPDMIGYIVLVWFILGFPVSYWQNKILFREVLEGGTPVFQEENSDVALEGGNLECQGESGDKS